MLTSLAFILRVGLAAAAICQQLKLPRIIGMLITGIILGPYVLDLLDPSILSISSELRQMALIIILLKAGLSLDLSDLKKVGRPAVLMSFVPASFEILAFFLFAPHILGIKPIEAAVMGAVLAAVSPAIVVPRMVRLMDQNYGTDKSIPQIILAGASCDDIFVIVLFSTFSNMAQGGNAHLMDFVNIPVSILFGIVLGGITGYLLSLFFETAYAHKHCVRNSMKVIIVLGISFLLMAIETWMKDIVSISGLLAVVSMACLLKIKSTTFVSKRLSDKFGKLWLAAKSHSVCFGRSCCRYPLYTKRRRRCHSHDTGCTSISFCRSCDMPYPDKAHKKRTVILYPFLSSKGYRSGFYWLCSACYGTPLRTDCPFRCSFRNFNHCPAWCHIDRWHLQKTTLPIKK